MNIKFEINGKAINPSKMSNVFEKIVLDGLEKIVREKYGNICHPETGEFPTIVVHGKDLDNLSFRVEGSPELLALVKERTKSENMESENNKSIEGIPKVFLCYATEDTSLTQNIAEKLQANSIDTWWDKWCIYPGDSLRQKIDEGLINCTHFVVLLTPNSINKSWVKHEIDAAFVRKVQNQCKFIPLRHNLPVSSLPPLLAAMYSPEILNAGDDAAQLVNDIYGVSRKPPLGEPPAAVIAANNSKTGYSPAATAIAKFFVEKTKHGLFADPQINVDKLAEETGLTINDTKDALFELSAFMRESHNHVLVEDTLFAEFDKFWKSWNPSIDAIKLATDIVNDPKFPGNANEIAQCYGWEPRRLNPAIAYLTARNVVNSLKSIGSGPYIAFHVHGNDSTRRFVKSRS